MNNNEQLHSFHIPVMGLAFTIDSPIRVAQYGISSVISIVDDELMEKMNAFYSKKFAFPYHETKANEPDSRAIRTTSYLNLVDKIVRKKYEAFCTELSQSLTAVENFLAMFPSQSDFRWRLQELVADGLPKAEVMKNFLQHFLIPGAIDVNIMTKVDKANFNKNEQLPTIYNDAHAALRGFANSTLQSSLVLSAGMNPSLYGYIAEFPDFYPDASGHCKKKIILKVSDFRSAMIQGSFLAKKGIWVSEYRIESGLNCGGHAFATDGLLLGPVMEEFKNRKAELRTTVNDLMRKALSQKEATVPENEMNFRVTVQGGVGTAEEHDFLLDYFEADSVGWGTPFLLVPEATATDIETRNLLAEAKEEDLYLSDLSPLGVPFNTLRGTTNDFFKHKRIVENKAGSSCPKKLLALSREFDEKGMCTASRKFQQKKLDALEAEIGNYSTEVYNEKQMEITVKACLCVGLANAAYLENAIRIKGEEQGVVICPGPAIAYFDREMSLLEMVRHIYGYHSVLANTFRPNMYVKELQLYVDYFRRELRNRSQEISAGQIKKWNTFKNNLCDGIAFYEQLFATSDYFQGTKKEILKSLSSFKSQLESIAVPELAMAE